MEHPEQHHIIVGERGSGKTTLLLRLAYEIENDEQLNKWLIPLVFNEEEYGIRRLYRLWIRIAGMLEEKSSAFEGLSGKMKELSGQMENDLVYGEKLYELLKKELKANGQKIILFIDNVGDMFTKFDDIETHRMRKILQTSPDIRLFAASAKMENALFDYKHPFYEFFKIEKLKGLRQEETEQLLKKLATTYDEQSKIRELIEKDKGRIETLRRLTEGNIRTLLIWYRVFIEKDYNDTLRDIEAVLDQMTPIYKHSMDDLPSQQQAIVEAIALNWDAVNVKEIRKQTRLGSRIVSAQISQLVKSNIVSRIFTNTKNHLYLLRERFFNIWYLLRYGGKKDKERVVKLIRFMEDWCENGILENEKKETHYALREPTEPIVYTDKQKTMNKDEMKEEKNNRQVDIIKLLAKEAFVEIEKKYGLDYLSQEAKPLYYVFVFYQKEKYPNQILRMGGEMKETVEEIVHEVELVKNSLKKTTPTAAKSSDL